MDGSELDMVSLSPAIGAEIRGVDLRAPLDDRRFRAIERLWLERSVLLFRGQDLSVERQVAFAERFGPAADVRVAFVDAIPRGPSGKHRPVESR